MPNVGDLMTRSLLSVDPATPVDQVARSLTEQGIDGVPVRDASGRVLGVISKSDLTDPSRMGAVTAGGKTAADVMSPVVFAVRTDDPARDAIHRMVETGSHRLVVVDEHEHVIGIITPMDVMRALLEGRLGQL